MTDQRAIVAASAALSEVPTDELRGELAKGLTLTAQVLTRLAMIWRELERRGEDLSDLRGGLAHMLPRIAAGLLAAEAVVAFAARPIILHALEGMPVEQQKRLAHGEQIAVIDPASPEKTTEMPLIRLPASAVRLVLVDGEVRTPEAQRLSLRRQQPRKAEPSERNYRPRIDVDNGTVQVGRMKVQLSDMVNELASSSGPDRPPPSDIPGEYLAVKVRLRKEEHERFLAFCKKAELPDWEMIRKAMRAYGLI